MAIADITKEIQVKAIYADKGYFAEASVMQFQRGLANVVFTLETNKLPSFLLGEPSNRTAKKELNFLKVSPTIALKGV